MDVKEYLLSGGSKVWVHQPFGTKSYIAFVEINGVRYPEQGKIAKDKGRQEYILVTSGKLVLTVNGQIHELQKGENYLIKDGDTYIVDGTAEAIVFVQDEEGGDTLIVDE